VEEMTHRPLLTRRELALEDSDREAGRHWRHRECWCDARHEAGDPDLIDPPWFASRQAEIPSAWAVAT
jgi:hypothetical protein